MDRRFTWTQAQTDAVRTLWQAGVPVCEIGRQVHRTMSSVRRHVRAMRLTPRPSPIKSGNPPKETYRERQAKRSLAVERANKQGRRDGLGFIRPLYETQTRLQPSATCRYPLWNNKERPTGLYCDAPTFRRDLCQQHYLLCWKKPPEPKHFFPSSP